MTILNKHIALLTKHQKQVLIEPVLQQLATTTVVLASGFDTDSLGSFDGITVRQGSARDCALKKAYLACELTGLTQGIGSEGSFNGHLGIGNLDQELLAFVDTQRNIEIVAVVERFVNLQPIEITSLGQVATQLRQFDQQQGWMINVDGAWHKGLIGEQAIVDVIATLTLPIVITPDFRAMYCPPRQQNIIAAAEDLGRRLQALCPRCATPDFVVKQVTSGLACEVCDSPTSQTTSTTKICRHCDYSEQQHVALKASSFYCPNCNP